MGTAIAACTQASWRGENVNLGWHSCTSVHAHTRTRTDADADAEADADADADRQSGTYSKGAVRRQGLRSQELPAARSCTSCDGRPEVFRVGTKPGEKQGPSGPPGPPQKGPKIPTWQGNETPTLRTHAPRIERLNQRFANIFYLTTPVSCHHPKVFILLRTHHHDQVYFRSKK